MTARTLLAVDGLSRTFDVSRPWLERALGGGERRLLRAVEDVSFSIGRGETFALVGESGSGKSTIARMIVGLMRPSAGRIQFDGVELAADAIPQTLRRRLTMIFQDPYASLNPRMTAERIIAEPIAAFMPELGPAGTRERVGELLAQVGLSGRDGSKYPHEFSGGQRQRVAIARALASRPDFIVCDEPTSALDISVQAQILNLMRDLQDELGLTYLLISHNLAVVRHMAARVGVLYLGRLVEVAPASELFAAPRHPYTRMLLDAVPDVSLSGRERAPSLGEIANPLRPPAGCPFHPRCRQAVARCREERPALRDIGAASAACHLA